MTRQRLPTWFRALLVADLIVTVLAAAMLVATRDTASPHAPAPVPAAAASILAGGVVVAAARLLWRREREAAAMTCAMLPMIAGVPYVFATLGLPF